MGITDILDDLFGIDNDGGARRPAGGSHSAFIAPTMKPVGATGGETLFENTVLFTGGNFMFSDFRLRISSNDKVEVQTNVHFGKLVTGHKVAPSPIVAFAFADAQGFTMPEKWVLDNFAKKCEDAENRVFSSTKTIAGVFKHTKQLRAAHSAWGFGYC